MLLKVFLIYFSGWLFGRGKNREAEKSKEKPKIEPATPLPYK